MIATPQSIAAPRPVRHELYLQRLQRGHLSYKLADIRRCMHHVLMAF